jgi:hypothetical protein
MNLKDICQLYSIMGDHLPPVNPEETIGEYTMKVLSDMQEYPGKLMEAFQMLTHLTEEQINKLPIQDYYHWWVDGFLESKILLLKNYLEGG